MTKMPCNKAVLNDWVNRNNSVSLKYLFKLTQPERNRVTSRGKYSNYMPVHTLLKLRIDLSLNFVGVCPACPEDGSSSMPPEE